MGEILHCTGYGGSLEQERGSFAQEDERQRGALNGSQAFDSSLP